MNIDQYVRSRIVDLGRSLKNRSKIYLDLRFWIIARDVAAGMNAGAAEQELLRLLCEGVAQGTMICPISETTFMELMKLKKTPSSRIATANIIDELSLGVAVIPLDLRIGTEIAQFTHARAGTQNLFSVDELGPTLNKVIVG